MNQDGLYNRWWSKEGNKVIRDVWLKGYARLMARAKRERRGKDIYGPPPAHLHGIGLPPGLAPEGWTLRPKLGPEEKDDA